MTLITNIKRIILTNELHFRRFSQVQNSLVYAFSKKSEILKYKPISLSIAAIDRCNFKCDMCHVHSKYMGNNFDFRHHATKDMAFDLLKKFVDKFNEALNVSIIGSGEPLLNKDFFKMVEYGKSMKMDISTTTNGSLLDAEMIKKIIDSKLDEITISLNGNNGEEFNRLTGMPKELHTKIVKNISNLITKKKQIKSRLFVTISTIIDKENYKQIPLIIKLGEELGVNLIAFKIFLPAPYFRLNADERCITIDDIEIINFIQNLKNNVYKVNVVWPLPLNYNKRRVCNQHFTLLRVDADENIGGCASMLLNLEKNGKYYDKDAWNNEYFRKMRSIFLDSENDRRLEPCKVCICSNS